MKKVIALLVTGVMMFSLMACGSTGNQSSQDGQVDQQEQGDTIQEDDAQDDEQSADEEAAGVSVAELDEVLIGVAISDPTNSEVMQLMAYLDSLSQELPISFKYSEAIENPEDELSFIENCAMSGCKGIIGQYTDNAASAIEKCAEFEMYYTGAAAEEEIYEAYKENPYYLGGISYGQGDYDALYEMGKYLTGMGCKKIIYANGGADFGVQMFVNRQEGFKAAIQEAGLTYEESVITVSGFPNDSFFSAQQSALTTDGVDAVCASFNGVDYWVTPMDNNGMVGTIPLASYGSLNDIYVQAMENGSLAVLAAVNVQKYGLEAALIFNAVNGDAAALKDDGVTATNKSVGVWIFSNPEDANKIYDLQENIGIYTAADIANLCTAVNPDATAATLQELIDSSTLEALLGE